jgi:phospholipid/cholesterol/gamma-HCH transport system substrate-binding protein
VNTEAMTPETLADMQESIKKLRSVLTRVDALLAQAQEGKGPLAKILNDPKMADDLSSFVSNLRRKGILFYSDLATQEKQDAKDNEKGKVKP